jgi:DNA-binding CsgD family transcriptional regulator
VVGARFPRAQRHIIEELAAWDSIVETGSGYVTGRLLRVWESAYFCLAVGDGDPAHDISPRHRELANVVLPHLTRAAELERRLQNASSQFNAFSQIVDRFPVAAISLDRHGAVTYLNAAALRLVDSHNSLIISRAGVHVASETSEAQLQRCIAEAIANETGDYFRRLSIGRTSSAACSLVVMSMHSDGSSSDSRSRCVIFVSDPNAQPVVKPDALSDFLGLTTSEARIVAELVAGSHVPQAAQKLGITPNTARTLLARAMARTGTNSQIDLVRKILMALVPVSEEI